MKKTTTATKEIMSDFHDAQTRQYLWIHSMHSFSTAVSRTAVIQDNDGTDASIES